MLQKVTPPQPIPYPDSPILKKLYRLPIPLFRLGLSSLIGKHILILSTYGRKSGKVHRTPLEYFSHQGQIFVMSGFGEKADWYRNLQAYPQAGVNIKNNKFCATAQKPHTEAEWDGVITFLKSSPVTHLSEPKLVDQLDDPEAREAIKEWPVLTFEPSDEPCPSTLNADLVWAWPLILGTAGLYILANWFYHRNR